MPINVSPLVIGGNLAFSSEHWSHCRQFIVWLLPIPLLDYELSEVRTVTVIFTIVIRTPSTGPDKEQIDAQSIYILNKLMDEQWLYIVPTATLLRFLSSLCQKFLETSQHLSVPQSGLLLPNRRCSCTISSLCLGYSRNFFPLSLSHKLLPILWALPIPPTTCSLLLRALKL